MSIFQQGKQPLRVDYSCLLWSKSLRRRFIKNFTTLDVSDFNFLDLLIIRPHKIMNGKYFFDFRIVFIHTIFIAVIKFHNFNTNLWKQYFFSYREITIIDYRNTMTKTCKTNERNLTTEIKIVSFVVCYIYLENGIKLIPELTWVACNVSCG